jgi:hypothetical protein
MALCQTMVPQVMKTHIVMLFYRLSPHSKTNNALNIISIGNPSYSIISPKVNSAV